MTSQGYISTFYEAIRKLEEHVGLVFHLHLDVLCDILTLQTSAIPKGLGKLQSQADAIRGVDRAGKESLHVTRAGERDGCRGIEQGLVGYCLMCKVT